jgi:hypothetical protein|tara:strand:+ start:449 stop:1321 length:873 start_codon:yes stop_codon:yes gene_type:complete
MLLKFKIINILFIFSALIFVKFSFAGNKSPIISVYNFEKNNLNKEYYKIIKNTVFKELNDNAFLTEDGNRFFKSQGQNVSSILNQINLEDKNNADIILFLNLSFLKISENKFFLNLKAEIYNVNLEKFITSWSTPSKEINFTNECDNVCKNLEVTRKLVLMASQLGENVSKILSLNYQQKENKNFIQQYNLIISGLNNNEALSLTDIMINEFPGFVKLINKEQYGSNYKYKYFSSANNLKIKKWLIIALNQLNLSEGKDIEINVNSNLISINKYPNNLSSGSKGNPKKFN